jgi:GTP-binding protein
LGHQFLRHVERTRLLIHMLEIEPADGSDPIENYHTIRQELAGYSPVLAEKPQIVALSKVDLLGGPEDQAVACHLIEQRIGVPVHPISSASQEGLMELLEICWNMLQRIPRPTPIDLLNATPTMTDADSADK